MKLLIAGMLGLLGTAAAVSTQRPAQSLEGQRLTAVIQEFRGRFGIPQPVSAAIVESNVRLVSVRRAEPQASSFVVEFDKNFLASLDQEELRAVIAHELGHVWIFTHHPYLQTEALANQKAMEVVGRETLERVYEKVWRIEGQQGTLQEFLVKVENSQQQASR